VTGTGPRNASFISRASDTPRTSCMVKKNGSSPLRLVVKMRMIPG
jgi:hypothetical protein